MVMHAHSLSCPYHASISGDVSNVLLQCVDVSNYNCHCSLPIMVLSWAVNGVLAALLCTSCLLTWKSLVTSKPVSLDAETKECALQKV